MSGSDKPTPSRFSSDKRRYEVLVDNTANRRYITLERLIMRKLPRGNRALKLLIIRSWLNVGYCPPATENPYWSFSLTEGLKVWIFNLGYLYLQIDTSY